MPAQIVSRVCFNSRPQALATEWYGCVVRVPIADQYRHQGFSQLMALEEKDTQVADGWLFKEKALMDRYTKGELSELNLFEILTLDGISPKRSP